VLKKRFRSQLNTGKVVLLLFFFSSVQAQNEPATDTIAPGLDTIEQVIEAPKEEYETAGEGKNVKYFLEKEQYTEKADSLHPRTLPTSVVKKLQGDEDYWYANAEIKKKKATKEDLSYTPLVQRSWFQTLLWLIIVSGFAGFIMWWLAGSNVSLFRKKAKTINDNGEEGVETNDIFSINYQKEIDKAAQQKNYRLAVRLMFLRLLKNLSEKNIIQYNQDKTNLDYLSQLQPTNYYKDFFRITRNYEYSWYGQFEVNEQAFYIIRSDFENFNRKLK
jgi:hypothetical protein